MEIRPFQHDDFPEVRTFLAEQFPTSPQKADERFFFWRFHQNPIGSSLPHYLLAWENGRIIGQMAGLRDRLRIGGEWQDCVWLVDLIVAPQHRGGLAALRLFQSSMKLSPLVLAVGAGPKLMSVYKALGWKLHPVAGTYFSIHRPAALLALAQETGSEPRSPLTRCLPLANPALRLVQWLDAARLRDSKVSIEQTQSFPVESDALVESLLPSLGITNFRSNPVLSWKFEQRPKGSHFLLTARVDGQLRGYAAVKRMRRHMSHWAEVTDILAHPEEPGVFRSLLSETIGRTHADFIRLRCSHPQHTALLQTPFWIRRNRPVIDDLLYFTKNKQLAEAIEHSPWHLTSVVSDRTDHGRDEWV